MTRLHCDKELLQIVAVIAMTAEHISAAFLQDGSLLSFAAGFIGNSAFPIMAFFLAEGICHTSSIRRYALRILAAGIAAEIPFMYFHPWKLNIMFTLLICLLVLYLILERKWELLALCSALYIPSAFLFDWDLCAPFFAVSFLIARASRNRMIASSFANASFYMFRQLVFSGWLSIASCLFDFMSIFLPCMLLALSFPFEKPEKLRLPRYFFYLYYPMHLVILMLISIH